MAQYTITTQAHPSEPAITLLLNGKISEESLLELESTLRQARALQPQIYIDLSEVTLVDRKAAEYFSSKRQNAQLINCPAYLERWISNGEGIAK
jgi:anti-anti-sigma regulatory factor